MLSHSVDDEWEMFVTDPTYEGRMLQQTDDHTIDNGMHDLNADMDTSLICPPSGNIYISTKSKIAYLTTPVKLGEVFWKLPIMRYDTHANGIVKKQMKFNSTSQEEVDEIENNMVGKYNILMKLIPYTRL